MTLGCNSYQICRYDVSLLSLHEHTGLNVALNHSPQLGLAKTHAGVHIRLTCCLGAQSIWRAVLSTQSGRVPPCAAQSQGLRSVQTQNHAARAFLPCPPLLGMPDLGGGTSLAVYAHLMKWQVSCQQSQELLAILRAGPSEPGDFKYATLPRMQQAVDHWQAAGGRGVVQQVDLQQPGDGSQDLIFYFRPALDCVLDLVRNPEFGVRMRWFPEILRTGQGDRVYAGFNSAAWSEHFNQTHAPHKTVIGVILSPDEFVLTGKQTKHAVYLTITNITEGSRCSHRAYVLAGLIPIWQRTKSLFRASTDRNDVMSKQRARQLHAMCIHKIVRSLTEAAVGGGVTVQCGDRIQRTVLPVLALIATDIPEGETLTFGRQYHCCACLPLPGDRTHAVHELHHPRLTAHARDSVMRAISTGRYGQHDEWAQEYESQPAVPKPFCQPDPALHGSLRVRVA